jgi:hypothetical protein
MKVLRKLLLFLMVAGFFAACQKEYSLENGGTGPGTGGSNPAWEFKENAVLFKGGMDTAYIVDLAPLKQLHMEGTSSNGLQSFDMVLTSFSGNVTVGTYKSGLAQVEFSYTDASGTLYEADALSGGDLSVTVSQINSTSASGTFSGTVLDGAGNSKTFTDGKFNARIGTAGGGGGGNGQVMLWAQQGCNAGPITVTVNSQSGTITTFQPSVPACGTAGTANYTLPAGTYTWSSTCNGNTVSGQVVVLAGQCTPVEINFAAPSTNCFITSEAEFDAATNARDLTNTSTYTGNLVTRVELIDSSSVPPIISNTFNITRPAGKVQVDPTQFFDTDGSGRVIRYTGLLNPDDNFTNDVVINYTYNAAGYLTKSTYADAAAPAIPLLQIDYTYNGANNVTSAIVKNALTNAKQFEFTYAYNTSLAPKNFRPMLPEDQFTVFHTAINCGKFSTNAVSQIVVKEYDAGGVTVVSTTTTNFDTYVLDANNYVKSVVVSGDDLSFMRLYSGWKYVYSYKCF